MTIISYTNSDDKEVETVLTPTHHSFDGLVFASQVRNDLTPTRMGNLIRLEYCGDNVGKYSSEFTIRGKEAMKAAYFAALKSKRKVNDRFFHVGAEDYHWHGFGIILLVPIEGGHLLDGRIDHFQHKRVEGNSITYIQVLAEDNDGIEIPKDAVFLQHFRISRTNVGRDLRKSAIRGLDDLVIETGCVYPHEKIVYYFDHPVG